MKNKKERIGEIISVLRIEGNTSLDKLAERFKVSTATIRRDVKILENSGQVFQAVGGDVIYKKDYLGPSREEMLSKSINEKLRIAEYCSTMIEDRDTVVIGPGVITNLAGRILGGLDKEFRVITNSLSLAVELSKLKNIDLFILGGDIENQYSTIKFQTYDPLGGIKYADKLLFTADGIDPEYGLTYYDSIMLPMISGMMRVAREKILIADSGKFGNVCFNFLSDLSEISLVVTDNNIKKSIQKSLTERNIRIMTV